MTDALTPKPEHKFTFGLWTVGNPGRDPFGEPVRPVLSPGPDRPPPRRGGGLRRQLPRQRPRADRRHAGPARPDREGLQEGPGRHRDQGPHGDDEPLRRPRVQGRRLHLERPAGPRLRAAEDDERDRPRRGARGEGLRLLGRPRGRRERRHQERARGRQALPRRAQLPDPLRQGQEVRPRLRPRGEAQRAAARHLPPHHRLLPRLHRDPRPPRDGGREPRGRPRAHVRPQLHARGRPGVGRGQALPHRPQRPGLRPLRPGPALRLALDQELLLPREVPRGREVPRDAPLRLPRLPHRGRSRASRTSPAARCGATSSTRRRRGAGTRTRRSRASSRRSRT